MYRQLYFHHRLDEERAQKLSDLGLNLDNWNTMLQEAIAYG